MKIYQTNAALGHNQLAFLIRLGKGINGYNYLCIGTQCIDDSDMYVVGGIVEDLEDYYVEDSTYDVKESPLYGTFLFSYFLSNYFK